VLESEMRTLVNAFSELHRNGTDDWSAFESFKDSRKKAKRLK
jgi:hypothetical protein